MEELKCEICGTRPPLKDNSLCRECSDRYATLLRSARKKTSDTIVLLGGSSSTQETVSVVSPKVDDQEHAGEETRGITQESRLEQILQPKEQRARKLPSQLIGYFLLGLGLLVLTSSVFFTSTILAFIGLGLTFWGVLAFFIQPQKYVKSDLMNATAISSLKTIDKMMVGMGYGEKGVYVPAGKEKAVVFIPSEPFSRIPVSSTVEGKTFLDDPQGMIIVPPGLALASLIEKKLGFTLKNCGVDTLIRALPKVLVEDLEVVQDVEVEVKGGRVNVKLFDSIYADFCKEVHDTSRRCGLGCPMCSALACILTVASGKPVIFEEDEQSLDERTTISSYILLDQPRL